MTSGPTPRRSATPGPEALDEYVGPFGQAEGDLPALERLEDPPPPSVFPG